MYPEKEKNLSAREVAAIESANPEGSAVRGKWSDPAFLNNITDLNPRLTRTQFADFHGHGWVFRAVYKQDRKGNLLDAKSAVVAPRRSAAVREGGPPQRHPSRKGHALHGLPLQAGRPR